MPSVQEVVVQRRKVVHSTVDVTVDDQDSFVIVETGSSDRQRHRVSGNKIWEITILVKLYITLRDVQGHEV